MSAFKIYKDALFNVRIIAILLFDHSYVEKLHTHINICAQKQKSD